MPEIIKALIFDLDGVIVDSNPAIEAFWKNWAAKEAIELTDALIREWIYGRKVDDTIIGLFDHITDSGKMNIKKSAYAFDNSMQPIAISGVITFIRAVSQLELPIGIVTSSHHPRMLKILERLGIEREFTHFVTALDVTKGKPDPEPYKKMSAKMNVPYNHCLVFEDAISGIQSATSAGMFSIGIGNEKTKHDLLFHGAKDVIEDFTQISINKENITILNGKVFGLSENN